MTERDGVEIGSRRLDADQVLKTLVLKRPLDGAQSVWALRMAGRGQVIEARWMGDDKRSHCQDLVLCDRKRKCRSLRQCCVGIVDAAGAFQHLAFETGGRG